MDFGSHIQDFLENGFAIIPNFLTENEVSNMKNEISKLIRDYNPADNKSIFSCSDKQLADDYFMNSADKIRYFLEEGVLDENGNLQVEKQQAINKIGHALHWKNEVFKQATFSDKVKELVKQVGFIDPAVVQGMYIFKNAGRGGEVTPHQDATYLYTKPTRLIGLWFPLEDATLENGCLWFQPGSHKDKLYARWIRNKDKSDQGPAMTYVDYDSKAVYDKKENFIAAPAKAGSCVLIDGLVIHKSCKNTSPHPRPAYTFHVFDCNGTVYSEDNWLQPTPSMKFPKLYDE